MEGRRLGPAGDDGGERLPWLEPVEDEVPQTSSGGRTARLILGGLFLVVLLLAAAAGWQWMQGGGSGATDGRGELIRAPQGDYKVPPPDPGGMEVEGKGDSAFATSAGAEPQARIDLSAVPEQPITDTIERRTKAGLPPKADSAPTPGADGTIQLGAFSSEAAANAAWKSLSARFEYLAPLAPGVIPVESGDKVLYRLRASGPAAAAVCGRLRVAGETCLALN